MSSPRTYLELASQIQFGHFVHYSSDFHIQVQDPDVVKAIGVLRSKWFNKWGDLTTINYGTAFAVNSKMVVTCLHNLFSEKSGEICGEILFIPGVQKGFINDTHRKYKCTKVKQIQFQRPSGSLAYAPLKEELALFTLDDGETLEDGNFIKIGSLPQHYEQKQMRVIGYPSQEYRRNIQLNDVYLKRQTLNGGLHSLNGHVIHHTMKTSVGLSGSPILATDQHGNYFAVGIHTHRGTKPLFNSGVYFNSQLLKKMKKFQENLNKGYKHTLPSIFRMPLENAKIEPVSQFIHPDQFFKNMQEEDNRDSFEFFDLYKYYSYEEYRSQYELFYDLPRQLSPSKQEQSTFETSAFSNNSSIRLMDTLKEQRLSQAVTESSRSYQDDQDDTCNVDWLDHINESSCSQQERYISYDQEHQAEFKKYLSSDMRRCRR